MNLKTVVILLVLALATIFALVWVLLTRGKPASCEPPSSQGGEHGNQSLVFADLTPKEMVEVVTYLHDNLGVPLVDAYDANPADNCIYYIDVQLPPKAEVLAFLDHNGSRPARQALAVVYFGNQSDPNITEYVVGPLPRPTAHWDVTVKKYGGKLPYHRRPVTEREYKEIELFLHREFSKAPHLLMECCEYDGTNFATLTTVPRGFQSGDRATWFVVFQNVYGKGYYLHPVGLEVLVNHSSLDLSQWRVSQVFYNGKYYEDMAQLESGFIQGNVNDVKVKKVRPEEEYGSMRPTGTLSRPGPLPYQPRGPRYCIHHNHVLFQAWSFSFGMDVNTGPRLFDIRFNGERVVYELSLQEALALYGSNCPGGMVTRYMDGSFGIGKLAFELIRGVDCPYTATYVDRHYLVESETPKVNKNVMCVFEHNMAVPLRRHFSNTQSLYYGGLAKYALVLRVISTLLNYDYVWDFIFYQNGAMEVKIHATGYISSSFLYDEGTDYGSRVGEHTLGTMHNHLINYKVDLDIGGLKNSLVAHDMTFDAVQAPWSPEHQIHRPRLTKTVLDTEDKAVFPLHSKMPRYIHFATNLENKWGHQRGYRIQIVSFAGDHLPEASSMERSISWGREEHGAESCLEGGGLGSMASRDPFHFQFLYKLAVTKRKEEEPTSSSIYNQNDPWTPTVAFVDFINNETIVNEDLVAWISVGFLHVPHSEDVPNTVTVGNGVGFFLRPYNYFNEDPSSHSADGVYFRSDQDLSRCEVSHLACLSKTTALCSPVLPPFTYSGFQNQTGA